MGLLDGKVAVVTGAGRGIGREEALTLAAEGAKVIVNDVGAGLHGEGSVDVHPAQEVVDLIKKDGGEAAVNGDDISSWQGGKNVVEQAIDTFGSLDILVNNAGLTFTYIDPPRFSRGTVLPFYTVGDEIIDNVITTNYLAADRLSRRVAAAMVEKGWGRIINVTTKLDTMNRTGTHPYGASKAALEMATEVWAKDVEGTGLTINIVNPGAGANTPGMAEEAKIAAAEGRFPRLVEPDEMVPPLVYVVSREADAVNGYRFDANAWDASLPAGEAAKIARRPAGFVLHPQDE
jgi:3-oxoacyl-[acyl-carrier protein] reductase